MNKSSLTRRGMARWLVAGVVLLGAGSFVPGNLFPMSSASATAADPFAGLCWKITLTPDTATTAAGRNTYEEYVSFDSLGFTLQEASRLGFSPSSYSVTPITGGAKFTVTLTSGSCGTMVWTGTLNMSNLAVSGTMVWTKGTNAYTYAFSGGPFTPPPAQ